MMPCVVMMAFVEDITVFDEWMNKLLSEKSSLL
jgi:hypothetical protein